MSLRPIRVMPVLALIASTALCLSRATASEVMSTEDLLNRLGVNTHLGGLTRDDPWNTDITQVASQLRYIGVRIVRDWPGSPSDGAKWKQLQRTWSPYGRFWTSIDEGSPAAQRKSFENLKAIYATNPELIYAVGGPNEEDDDYARALGATLPDAASVQKELYTWAHTQGRNLPVSQMEFGAGWSASNNWQGDYNPSQTGIGQNYTAGPADLGGAHTYISNPQQRPSDVLNMLRKLASTTTPAKPVAHTEVGAYLGAKLSPQSYGRYMVIGALTSAAAGDAAYLVYGLQDSGPEQTYGFYTYPGGKPHPVAQYFHTMTTLLASAKGSYGPGARSAFKPKPIDLTFSAPAEGRLVMQKPTGEYVIAVWSEQLFDGMMHDVDQTINLCTMASTALVYDIEAGLSPVQSLKNTRSITVRMMPNEAYLVVVRTK